MIIFTIIGVIVVGWLVISILEQSTSKKRRAHKSPPQTQNIITYPVIFELIQDLNRRLFNELKYPFNQEVGIELAIVDATYVSLLCNKFFNQVSSEVDAQLYTSFYKLIRYSPYEDDIKLQFGNIDMFLRTRILATRKEIKRLDFYNGEKIGPYLPWDIFKSVVLHPLQNWEKIPDDIQDYDPAENPHVVKFERALYVIIAALTDMVQTTMPKHYNVSPVRIGNVYSDMLLIINQIDFTYYPLFEDFCVMCGEFYPRSEMVDINESDAEIGFSIKKMCRSCAPHLNIIEELGL